jgi:branched-chain amino acid transport system substrate-binding protein
MGVKGTMIKLIGYCIVAGVSALLASVQASSGQDSVKIGIIAHFSGPFAVSGVQFRQGIETYQSVHGDHAGQTAIELIYRDVGGANPAESKRLVQDLVVRDKATLLGGFYLSPDASAAASVVTETKTPAVLFNPGSPPIVRQSPYFVRVAPNIWQEVVPVAEWAIKSGKKRAYIAVADFSAGHDVQQAFKTRFTALGSQIIGEDRMPLNTVDFSAFVERIAGAKPEIVQVFVPSGALQVSFLKALAARGVLKETTVVGLANETDVPTFDDSMIGYYSVSHYAPALQADANQKFKEALKAKFGARAERPTFLSAAAYDGMQVLYRMIASQQGKQFDSTSALDAVRGYSWEGPRGSVAIDAETREFVPNEYIQRLEKIDGVIQNVLVETSLAVANPWTPLR